MAVISRKILNNLNGCPQTTKLLKDTSKQVRDWKL